MMARAKRIYILMIKVNKLYSFFSSRRFIREIENMYSVFLSSYRNTRGSLGELDKAVKTLACGSCSAQHFSFFQTSTRLSITRQKHGTCFLFLKQSSPNIPMKANSKQTAVKLTTRSSRADWTESRAWKGNYHALMRHATQPHTQLSLNQNRLPAPHLALAFVFLHSSYWPIRPPQRGTETRTVFTCFPHVIFNLRSTQYSHRRSTTVSLETYPLYQ